MNESDDAKVQPSHDHRAKSGGGGGRWKHGSYSVEAERAAFNAKQRMRHALVLMGMRLLLKRQRADLRNARRRLRRRIKHLSV
jgi:hypothetical protein